MNNFNKLLNNLTPGSYMSVQDKDTQEIVNGFFHEFDNGLLALKAKITGKPMEVKQRLKATAEMFDGYIPNMTFIQVENIKKITTFKKYAKEESENQRQETDEDS